VIERRELDSRDDAGLVVVDSLVETEDGREVFAGDMKFLFKRRDAE
jgi:hypothetical protein